MKSNAETIYKQLSVACQNADIADGELHDALLAMQDVAPHLVDHIGTQPREERVRLSRDLVRLLECASKGLEMFEV